MKKGSPNPVRATGKVANVEDAESDGGDIGVYEEGVAGQRGQ